MADYLVTGAAGFIGSQVATRLLAQGHRVCGVDNLNHAYSVAMKAWRLQKLLQIPGFELHEVDIVNGADMAPLFAHRRFAAVLHLAARAGVRASLADPDEFYRTNTQGTLRLLELCRGAGVSKLVLASTSSLYGAQPQTPFTESMATDRPLSPYAASKKAAEVMCHAYHHLYGIDVTILRYFTVFGPAGRPDMSLFRFTQWICEGREVRIYGDGSQIRDFTYVDDVAEATVRAAALKGFEIINIGGGCPATLTEALRIIESCSGQKAKLNLRPKAEADVERTHANITRAQKLLDWTPKVKLEEGLRHLVTWYQAQREWAKEVDTKD